MLGIAHIKRGCNDIEGAEQCLVELIAKVDAIEQEDVRKRFQEAVLNLDYAVKMDAEAYPEAVDVAWRRHHLLLSGLSNASADERLLSSEIDLVYAWLKAGEETKAYDLLLRIEQKIDTSDKNWFSIGIKHFHKLELWIAAQLIKVYMYLEQWGKAKAILEKEDQYYFEKQRGVTTRWILCLFRLVECHLELGESEEARKTISRAKNLLWEQIKQQGESIAHGVGPLTLAYYYDSNGDVFLALDEAKKAREMFQELNDEQGVDDANEWITKLMPICG